MEEILKEILSQMQSMSTKMEERFNKLEVRQDETNARLTKLESGQDETNAKLTKLESGQDETNASLTKLETKIENVTDVKIQALFEDREIVHGKLDKIVDKLEKIEGQIIDHDIKIQVISSKTKAV